MEEYIKEWKIINEDYSDYEMEIFLHDKINDEFFDKLENLIKRNKELEEKAYKKEYYEEVADELYKNSIPKSKVRVLIEKYRAFGWHNKDDEYWANRILDGFEKLLQEGDDK